MNRKEKEVYFLQLLNDKDFWRKFLRVCLSQNRIKNFKEYRDNKIIPTKTVLANFIKEDFIFITKDKRPEREIMLDLLTEKEPCLQKNF